MHLTSVVARRHLNCQTQLDDICTFSIYGNSADLWIVCPVKLVIAPLLALAAAIDGVILRMLSD